MGAGIGVETVVPQTAWVEAASPQELPASGAWLVQKPHEMCKLHVQDILLGADRATQVTFTIPQGLSGRDVLASVARVGEPGYFAAAVYLLSDLHYDPGLDAVAPKNRTYSFFICEDSGGLGLAEHQLYLERHDLELASRWLCTVGAALYWDKMGGASGDFTWQTAGAASLFKGRYGRTADGSIGVYHLGLDGVRLSEGSCESLVVIGTPKSHGEQQSGARVTRADMAA